MMIQNKLFNPGNIGFFRTQAIVFKTNLVANLIEQFLGLRRCRICLYDLSP
jgi:hypothetical protein